MLNDKDDQGQALDLVFLNANNSLGTENSAPNITDANADAIIGIIPIASADFVDIGGCRIATLRNIGLPLKAASGTTTLYMGAQLAEEPEHIPQVELRAFWEY